MNIRVRLMTLLENTNKQARIILSLEGGMSFLTDASIIFFLLEIFKNKTNLLEWSEQKIERKYGFYLY